MSKFSRTVTKGLLPPQQATISQVVCGMLFSPSLILAEIARGFETVVEFGHNLKRVFRSVDNERITQQRSKEVMAARIIHQWERRLRLKPGPPLEVIIDWTWVGPYLVPSALIGVRGRAVPVLPWVVLMGTLKKSQHTLEEEVLRSLSRAIPRSRPVVIVADRGFGRTALFEFLPTLGFHSVIGVTGKVWMGVPWL